jgi:hypothetical protein
MPAYRAPRVGDLLAVRTSDPYDDREEQVFLDTVVDNGRALLLRGRLAGTHIEVLIRRVGDTDPLRE